MFNTIFTRSHTLHYVAITGTLAVLQRGLSSTVMTREPFSATISTQVSRVLRGGYSNYTQTDTLVAARYFVGIGVGIGSFYFNINSHPIPNRNPTSTTLRCVCLT